MSGDACDFNIRCKLSSSFFFLQGKVPNEIHAILTETLGKYAPSYATVKNWVAQFKRGDSDTCDAPRPGRPKTVTTQEITDHIHKLKKQLKGHHFLSDAENIPAAETW